MNNYTLKQTCGACPEQYDVYRGKELVGYIRLHNGYFSVRYPNAGGILLMDFTFRNDSLKGYFETDKEREYFLNWALDVIWSHECNWLKENKFREYTDIKNNLHVNKEKIFFTEVYPIDPGLMYYVRDKNNRIIGGICKDESKMNYTFFPRGGLEFSELNQVCEKIKSLNMNINSDS